MLVDMFGRNIDYLRLSVTDRCNLSCVYCSPSEVNWKRRGEILSYEEMITLIRVFCSLGMRRVRLTGGEPLLRRDFVHFVREMTRLNLPLDLSLTTNGILFPELAEDLLKAGLKRLNISLDTLDREKYKKITGVDGLLSVLRAVDVALGLGFNPVKINVVVVRGMNDGDIEAFADLASREDLTVRFIEYMPSGLAVWDRARLVPTSEVMERLKMTGRVFSPLARSGGGPSLDYSSADMRGRIGFISSVTQPSCAACNRLRVTAEGKLRPCLLSEKEIDLKSALRGPNHEEDLREVILEAVRVKPEGGLRTFSRVRVLRPMAQIGG